MHETISQGNNNLLANYVPPWKERERAGPHGEFSFCSIERRVDLNIFLVAEKLWVGVFCVMGSYCTKTELMETTHEGSRTSGG